MRNGKHHEIDDEVGSGRILEGTVDTCTFKEFIEHMTGVPYKEIYKDDDYKEDYLYE